MTRSKRLAILPIVLITGVLVFSSSLMTACEDDLEPPILCGVPATVDFGASETSRTLTISNCGDEPLSFSVSVPLGDAEQWLSIKSSTSGKIPARGSTNIQLTVDRAGLAVNEYRTELTITTSHGTADVTVSMTKSDAPLLCLDPDEINFGTTHDLRELKPIFYTKFSKAA